jgi:hypothetical protein
VTNERPGPTPRHSAGLAPPAPARRADGRSLTPAALRPNTSTGSDAIAKALDGVDHRGQLLTTRSSHRESAGRACRGLSSAGLPSGTGSSRLNSWRRMARQASVQPAAAPGDSQAATMTWTVSRGGRPASGAGTGAGHKPARASTWPPRQLPPCTPKVKPEEGRFAAHCQASRLRRHPPPGAQTTARRGTPSPGYRNSDVARVPELDRWAAGGPVVPGLVDDHSFAGPLTARGRSTPTVGTSHMAAPTIMREWPVHRRALPHRASRPRSRRSASQSHGGGDPGHLARGCRRRQLQPRCRRGSASWTSC